MSTAAKQMDEPAIKSVRVTDSAIIAVLRDGRTVSVPLAWSYRLELATSGERENFEIFGNGAYVHWPDIDEDLSAQGFLTGTPVPRGTKAHRDYLRDRRRVRAGRQPSRRTSTR